MKASGSRSVLGGHAARLRVQVSFFRVRLQALRLLAWVKNVGPKSPQLLRKYSSEVMPLFHRSNLWGSPKCPCTLIVLVYTLAPKYLYKNYFKAKIYTIWVHGPVEDCDRCYSLLCGRNPTPPAQIPETDPFHRRCYFVSKTHATQFSPKQSRKHQVCDP